MILRFFLLAELGVFFLSATLHAEPPLTNGVTQNVTNAPPNAATNSVVAPTLSSANDTRPVPTNPITIATTNATPTVVTPNASLNVRPEPAPVRSVNIDLATVSPIQINNQNPHALDLQTCFQLTAVRNDTLKINVQDILIARARLSESIANLFPTFSVNNQQEFIHYLEPNRGVSFSNSGLSGTISGNRNYESESNVNMSYTLFNGGQNYNTIASNDAILAQKKFNLERTYQTIYQSVAQAFYQILQYQGDIAVQKDLVDALQARVDELRDRVRIGRSRPAELLQAQVTLATTRVTIENSKGALNSALETLSYYVGIPANQIALKETQKFPSAEQVEAYLERSGARPDILAEYQNLRSYERNLSVARGALLPTITANGDFLASQDPTSNTVDATMTLEASMPIFDGGLILSKINENKQLVRQEQLNLDDLKRTTDEGVRQAYANFNASVSQVLVLREAVVLSAQNFSGQLSDYRRGVVANLDVLTALQDYQNTRQQLHDADMSARINLINLHVAAGDASTGPGANNQALPIHPTAAPEP